MHSWQFFRAGGVDQVLIRTGADIAHLDQLDQKLWVALACPTRTLEFDTRTLDLIDTDHDGRIRPPELLAACRWACAQLKEADELVRGGDTLALSAFDEADASGAALAGEARRILQLLGRDVADTIALADVVDRSRLLAAMRFNGDGIVTPATAEDAEVRAVIEQIVATQGSVADCNGLPGIDAARAKAFFADARRLDAWHAQALHDDAALPLGADTLPAAEALEKVRVKVDDFFARCRVAAYDPRATPELNPGPDTYRALGAQMLQGHSVAIADLPLAPVWPGRPLPLAAGANPAWADALDALRRHVVEPMLQDGLDLLDEPQWEALKTRLAASCAWLRSRPSTSLDTLEVAPLRRRLAEGAEVAVMELIAQDQAMEPHHTRIGELEKLLRFKRDLLRLLHNFVSFQEFYGRKGAVFQAGTLYLDGRSCDLVVQVGDATKHAVLAGLAKTYLTYCTCTRQGKTMQIAAAFTAGDVDFLFVGRNGVFYDREGHDWDATITKLIENPTSVGQAFLSPYKKFLRVLEEQVAKRAAASETAAQASFNTLASGVVSGSKAGGAAPAVAAAAEKLPGRIDVGTVAAIGVALGSISAVLVGVFGKFVDLGPWIPIAVCGIVLAISGPSMLIAWLKLRQRSLGPLLDACGWAINGRMKVNVRLGASLSQTGHVPPSASRLLQDPFKERHGKAWLIGLGIATAVLLAIVWRAGWANALLPAGLRYQPPVPQQPVVMVPVPASAIATPPAAASSAR